MRHLIDSLDLSVAETQEILDLADRIAADSAAYAHCADGKILATLFYTSVFVCLKLETV